LGEVNRVKADRESKLVRIRRSISSGIWAHLPIIAVISVFLLVSLILLDSNEARVSYNASVIVKDIFKSVPHFVALGGVIGLIWLLLTRSRGRNLKGALRWVTSRNWLEIVFLRIPLAFFLMSVVGYLLLNFKINIHNFAAYSWDHYFAEIDRLLFFGYDPWVLSHRVFNTPDTTKLLDNLYLAWFLVQKICALYVAVLPFRHRLRLAFLMTYSLNWLFGGVFLAILLPAAGPVYMEAIYGDPMFKPLMDLLYQQSSLIQLKALSIQEWLWDGFTKPDADPFGISAFPSLHVEMATACACLGFAVHRAIGWLLVVFTAITLIGSVHLGWHYAIDGIAGIFLAIVIWRISIRVTDWWLARTETNAAGQTLVAAS
jgi:hypothetical protein